MFDILHRSVSVSLKLNANWSSHVRLILEISKQAYIEWLQDNATVYPVNVLLKVIFFILMKSSLFLHIFRGILQCGRTRKLLSAYVELESLDKLCWGLCMLDLLLDMVNFVEIVWKTHFTATPILKNKCEMSERGANLFLLLELGQCHLACLLFEIIERIIVDLMQIVVWLVSHVLPI